LPRGAASQAAAAGSRQQAAGQSSMCKHVQANTRHAHQNP
jgi:hypothetical protein